MHIQIHSKAATPGHRLGVPAPPSPARRGELRPGTDAHRDGDAQRTVQIVVYSRVLSLRSLHGSSHCLVTFRAKLFLRPPQANQQDSAAFAEFEFAGVDHLRGVKEFSVPTNGAP